MARSILRLELEVPEWSPKQLRDAVVAIDALNSGPGQAILPENVDVMDILMLIANGDLGVAYRIRLSKMEEV